MRVPSLLAVALLGAADLACAAPSSSSSLDAINARGSPSYKVSPRPNHKIGPKHPGKPFPSSPPRTKTCLVQSHGAGKDDSDYILKAIKECNFGGHVVFEQGTTYTVGTALDLTFLKNVDLGMAFPSPPLLFTSLPQSLLQSLYITPTMNNYLLILPRYPRLD